VSARRTLTRERWYAQGLQFECTRCGDCCRGAPGYVWVTDTEIGRAADFLGMVEGTFRRQFVRRVGSRWSFRERDDGDCVFYRDGCVIYPVRPTQCVIFPFWGNNVRSPDDWEAQARSCPGINRGRLWSEADIRMSLRADGGSVGGTDPFLPHVTEAALAELRRLYRVVDRELEKNPGECEACGDCCSFAGVVPDLYASVLELALVLRWVDRLPKRVGKRCPFLRDDLCTVRPVRPLGCRTHYCRDDSREVHQALHERVLSRMKEIARRSLVPWEYRPFLEFLSSVVPVGR